MHQPPRARPRRAPFLVVVAAVAVVGCSSGDTELARSTSGERTQTTTADTGSSTTTLPEDDRTTDSGLPQGWTPAELEWRRCAVGSARGECAELTVPLDWSDPDGDTIQLALGRIPATGDRIGSLLTNPGGPGASGLEFLGYGVFDDEVAERFDVVSWDPRGVGRSTAVTCGRTVDEFYAQDPGPDDDTEQQALDAAARAVSQECGETDSSLLAHIGTTEVARDLEAIRLALGGEPLNYVGFSYGTHIGLRYAEAFGENLRAMVLDGVVDPAQGFEEFLTDQAEGFEQSLRDGARDCAAAGSATCGVDDLVAAYEQVATQVETTRLPGGPDGVGPAEVATAAIFSGYVPEGWQLLGQALAQARQGDGSGLWDLAAEYLDFGSYGAYAGVVCTDTPHPQGEAEFREFAERLEEVAPHFGASTANEMLPCATWSAPVTGEAAPIRAPDAPTILVVGNTGDPATPLANAEAVADQLEDGRLVVVDMDGHTAYRTDLCATRLIDDYLIDLAVPEAGTRC